jgi:NADH-quinone oxidoreductase subunit J
VTEVVAAGAFYVFALAALVGGLGVVSARHVVRSALFLMLALSSVAAIYVLLSADFVAAVQILIYTGAIMLLLLFAIMLTPQQVELPPFASAGQQVAAGVVAAALLALLVGTVLVTPWPLAATPLDRPTTEAIGQAMLTTFVFPFELASLVLLVGLVGALLLARED